MEWIRKYWPILMVVVGIISTAVTAQVQIATNTSNIETNKVASEKAQEELKADIEKLEDQKTEQAVMKANQENMKDDLKEIKDLLRGLKK